MIQCTHNPLSDRSAFWSSARRIMVMSHFPIYHSNVVDHLDHSLAHYLGDEPTGKLALESDDHFVPVPSHCRARGSAAGPECATIGEFQQANNDALQPILKRWGVDIYNAGHVHDCEHSTDVCPISGLWPSAECADLTGASAVCTIGCCVMNRTDTRRLRWQMRTRGLCAR
jgi:hypothetical protein